MKVTILVVMDVALAGCIAKQWTITLAVSILVVVDVALAEVVTDVPRMSMAESQSLL